MKACHDVTDGEVIAIDGKTVRSSYDKSKRRGAIHMVSAFASANGVVIGQVKTDGKSNEITPIPDLLKLLDIKGCLVTIDAMGCQRDITNGILQSLECSDGSIMVAKCNLIILIPNSTKQLFSLQPQQGKRTNPLDITGLTPP